MTPHGEFDPRRLKALPFFVASGNGEHRIGETYFIARRKRLHRLKEVPMPWQPQFPRPPPTFPIFIGESREDVEATEQNYQIALRAKRLC